ncbi:MAG: copper-translocating P-type ATPase [Deltaproteobacteria bacterium]|nr:copper-translocating P-type ATPase [Deltaproteobacteria bacterium]
MKTATHVIPIVGMRCAGCAHTIEKKVLQIPGVEFVSVNFASKKAFVRGEAALDLIIKTVESLGYQVNSNQIVSPEVQKKELARQKKETLGALLLSLPVFLLSMLHVSESWSGWVQLILSLPVLYLGRQFFKGAWKSLKHRRATMDSLVAIGTGTAFLYSCLSLYSDGILLYFESSTVVLSLVLLGRTLEEIAKQRSSTALTELMTLTPQKVILITQKGNLALNEEISISQIKAGDLFLVRPAEIVATDGEVVEGISSVEESKLTGESVPKEKGPGAQVYGGTLNQNGRLVVRATALGEETRLAKLIKVVEEAQGTKTEIQRLADRVSAVFVPGVLVIAVVTFVGWWVTGHSLTECLLPSMAVLVIACPCALGLATPTALISGMGTAAEMGILIRDAKSLERTHKVDWVLLDKTGTLTQGAPKVVESFYCPTGKNELPLIAAIETQASHPLAQAISNFAKQFDPKKIKDETFSIESFRNVPGMGCSGRVNGKQVFVGSRLWMENQGINTIVDWIPHAELERIKIEGKSRVWASVDNHLACVLVIHDELRNGVEEAIRELKKAAKVKIVSGDNSDAVEKVARQLEVTDWMCEVTPTEKAEEVKRLQKMGYAVAMVGDGVNDGPALAVADVSFTLGGGTDLAKEVASMTLLKGELKQVVVALRLSHHVMRVIWQNLWAAFFYNTLSIPIAAFGLLNPMVAGLAMALSSVSVVLNSLRLKGLIRREGDI